MSMPPTTSPMGGSCRTPHRRSTCHDFTTHFRADVDRAAGERLHASGESPDEQRAVAEWSESHEWDSDRNDSAVVAAAVADALTYAAAAADLRAADADAVPLEYARTDC